MNNDENVKKALASVTQSEESRRALAEAIIEWVEPNHLTNEIVSLLLDTRSLKTGDMLIKKLRKSGIHVRKLVPGTIHLADEMAVSDRVNYVLDGCDIKVNANLWDLERGEIGTLDEIRREMSAKLVDFYAGKVFTSLSTIWSETNTAENYAEVATALDKTTLDDAIDRINYRSGGVKAIVGVKNTLLPITEFAGYGTYDSHKQMSDPILTEALRSGWIGQYRGVSNIIGLDQIWNDPEDNEALLPENYVVVIGQKAGEFVTFGDPQWKDYEDIRWACVLCW